LVCRYPLARIKERLDAAVLERLDQQRAVGQGGQRVVEGLVGEQLGRLRLGSFWNSSLTAAW